METTATGKRKRPLGVTIALWVILISGLVNLLGGLALVIDSDTAQTGEIQDIVVEADVENALFTDEGELLLGGSAAIIIGLGELAISIGFWRLRRWAWVAAMTWQAFNLLVNLLRSFSEGPDIISLIFAIVLVLLLNQPEVKRAFGITRQQNEPPAPVTPLSSFDVN